MISFDEFLALCVGMLFWLLLVFELHELHELSTIELQRKASHNFIAQHTTSVLTLDYQIRISTCGMPNAPIVNHNRLDNPSLHHCFHCRGVR
jgi:hypothetical protein